MSPLGGLDRLDAFKDARETLGPQEWFLLMVLGATSFFDGFDRGIIELALPQIRETFDLTQSSASLYLSVVYLGALPALFITRWADRVGRRRLLMVSIIGYTISTGLTALAPTAVAFVACQFVARLFLNAESAIVWTMAAEELPAKSRGFGFGWLAMNSALGVGLGAILYGGVFESAGLSWRWLYVVGLPPLIGIGFLRRRLPESRRFVRARDTGRLAAQWHAILRRPHRRWLVLIVLTSALIELTTQAGAFAIDYLQTDRGLSQSASNFMLVGAGLPGIPIMIYAGALSDRHGRRVVGVGFSIMSLVGAMGFFWGPGGIPFLLGFMMLMIVGSLGAWPTLGAYTSELFPTALRGQASSWATCARVAGQSGSFALGGLLLAATDSFPTTVSLLAIGPLIAVVIFAMVFPDTHGRELEDISGEEVGPLTIGSSTLPL